MPPLRIRYHAMRGGGKNIYFNNSIHSDGGKKKPSPDLPIHLELSAFGLDFICICKSHHSPNILDCLLCVHSIWINEHQLFNARLRSESYRNQFDLRLQQCMLPHEFFPRLAKDAFTGNSFITK